MKGKRGVTTRALNSPKSWGLLTIKRRWFTIEQLLPYNGKQNTAVVTVRGRKLRKNITKNHCPGVFPLVHDL
jgi:hypothetical protein